MTTITKEEINYAWKGCIANMEPSDTVIFYSVRSYKQYKKLSVMNNEEITKQAKMWRKHIRAGAIECHDYNNTENTIDGKKYYGLVVQQEDYENLDPLGLMIMGYMVSGCIYFFISKHNRDSIFNFINEN